MALLSASMPSCNLSQAARASKSARSPADVTDLRPHIIGRLQIGNHWQPQAVDREWKQVYSRSPDKAGSGALAIGLTLRLHLKGLFIAAGHFLIILRERPRDQLVSTTNWILSLSEPDRRGALFSTGTSRGGHSGVNAIVPETEISPPSLCWATIAIRTSKVGIVAPGRFLMDMVFTSPLARPIRLPMNGAETS